MSDTREQRIRRIQYRQQQYLRLIEEYHETNDLAMQAAIRDILRSCDAGHLLESSICMRKIVEEAEAARIGKKEVLLSFTVSMTYDIPVRLQVPAAADDADIIELINGGEIDWLGTINEQHTSIEIEQMGKVEHRQLLAVELVKKDGEK